MGENLVCVFQYTLIWKRHHIIIKSDLFSFTAFPTSLSTHTRTHTQRSTRLTEEGDTEINLQPDHVILIDDSLMLEKCNLMHSRGTLILCLLEDWSYSCLTEILIHMEETPWFLPTSRVVDGGKRVIDLRVRRGSLKRGLDDCIHRIGWWYYTVRSVCCRRRQLRVFRSAGLIHTSYVSVYIIRWQPDL